MSKIDKKHVNDLEKIAARRKANRAYQKKFREKNAKQGRTRREYSLTDEEKKIIDEKLDEIRSKNREEKD